MKLPNFVKLVIAIVVSELAGAIGAIFTISSVQTWYTTLNKPALNPPSWVFSPVWTILFVLMGIAAYLVWNQGLRRREVKIALSVFLIQLVLNLLWTIIFFGLHNPGWAFIEIMVLWLAILFTILAFYKVSPKASYLLIPYILWVSFAGYLNFSIWRLNMESVPPLDGAVACTMEAKICPDGTAVGRSGPNCEFTACPELTVMAGWLDYTDAVSGLSFSYPADLTTEYTSTVNWPPKIEVSAEPFSCTEKDPTSSLPERVSRRIVDNRLYCLRAVSEGAAGSVYTDYRYETEKDGRLVTLSFTLRDIACYNYDEPQKTACTRERESFDLDGVVDRMMGTLKFNQ